MGLNDASNAQRAHIAFFGMRNAGKSSLINAVCGQDLSVVSDVAGTTTDPVRKAMELLPIGPVLMIDTPGIDDEGALGDLRVDRALRVMDSTDVAVLAIDSTRGLADQDRELAAEFGKRKVPFIAALSKCDITASEDADATSPTSESSKIAPLKEQVESELGAAATIPTSAATNAGIHELKEAIGRLADSQKQPRQIVGDLLEPEDDVVLVVPIDSSAPKGRLILPQQMTIRDALDAGAHVHIARAGELEGLLASLASAPKMVITDSQVFKKVASIVDESIALTSFSILMARYKGTLAAQVDGANELDALQSGSKVLLAEGCTHHRQCDDIGTVKMPCWIREHAGCEVSFEFSSGGEFPKDLSSYQLVIHCGGCMLNEREMTSRMERAKVQGVPCTNYGMAIAKMNGILNRALRPLR